MWWPTHARSPFATQNVLFSSAPQASSVARAPDRERAALAARSPRERRSISGRAARRPRTTESSVRVWIGRSWSRNSVGDAAEALERVVVA